MKKLALLLVMLTLFAAPSQAQVSISNAAPYNSDFYLINDVFAGGNVTVSNVQSYGADRQIGFFSNGSGFGIDSGLVLSTGDISSLCPSGCTVTGTSAPGAGGGTNFGPAWFGTTASNNLLSVSNQVPGLVGQGTSASNMNDAAAIWFDFIPNNDTMVFRFSFVSSEWDSYPCSQYNDAFGFFVSGPGITGTFNAPVGFPNGSENFATVPGTNPAIPITITSITNPNAGSIGSCSSPNNSQFYVGNNQATSGINSTITAYTTVIEVKFPVVPCQTYNFCMAIADGSDGALDSYVMMEANSFTSSGVSVNAVPTYTSIGDSILYEGCGGVIVDFVRHDSILPADSINISYGGTATSGIDFTTLPDSLYFNAGQSTYNLNIDMFSDNIIEGPETLYIWVDDTAIAFACGNIGDSLMLVIHDPLPIITTNPFDTVLCADTLIDFYVEVQSGLPSYSFNWSNGDTDSVVTINQAPGTIQTYNVTITDACGVDSVVDSITYITTQPVTISPVPDICGADTIQLQASISGGEWNGVGIIDDSLGIFYAGPNSFGNFDVTYEYSPTPFCSTSDTVNVNIYSVYTPNTIDNVTLCEGESIQIDPDTNINNGNNPNFNYWFSGVGINSTGLFDGNLTGNGGPFVVYYNMAFGNNECVGTDSILVSVYPSVSSDFISGEYCNNITTNQSLNPSFPFGIWSISSATNGDTTWNPMGFIPANLDLGEYVVTYLIPDSTTANGCGSETTASVFILETPAAPSIDPDTLCFDTLHQLYAQPDSFNIVWYDSANLMDTLHQGAVFPYYEELSGDFTFYVQANNGSCYSPVTTHLLTILPGIDLSFTYSPTEITPPATVEAELTSPNSNLDYFWLLSNGSQLEGESISFSINDGTFNPYEISVFATNMFGCSDTNSMYIWLSFNGVEANIPNVFTPNGDGYNDVFGFNNSQIDPNVAPFLSNYKSYEVNIFNRWGNNIFTFSENQYWDGSDASDGTYYYVITGVSETDEEFNYSGEVTLLRGAE